MSFGRDELPVGRVGRTDEGSFEDLEDRESTRNGKEKLWQILALRKHGKIQKGIQTTKHRDQQRHGRINAVVIFSNSSAVYICIDSVFAMNASTFTSKGSPLFRTRVS